MTSKSRDNWKCWDSIECNAFSAKICRPTLVLSSAGSYGVGRSRAAAISFNVFNHGELL
jgi:hypothetical protein